MTEDQARAIASDLFTLRKLVVNYIGLDVSARASSFEKGSEEFASLIEFIDASVELDKEADKIFHDCMAHEP